MMPIDPGLVPLMFAVLALLAACTIPLAACILFAGAFLLCLNPPPLPDDFLLDYSLAVRLNSPALISVPLFVLAGELAVAAGIGDRLLNLADALAGRGPRAGTVRTVAGSALFATVSAVGPAAVAAEGKRLIPEMLAAGYSRSAAAGILACVATLAIVIPTSVPLTVYAAAAGVTTNIVFAASFVPGLILAAGFLLVMLLRSRRRRWRERRAGRASSRMAALVHARWAVLLPVLVLTSLFTGFFTAPEAAAFACLHAVLVGRFAHRDMAWTDVPGVVERAAATAAGILLMAGMGGLLAMLMGAAGVTEAMAVFIHDAAGGPAGAIIVMNGVLLALGCFLDTPSLITMVVPLLLPLAARCGMAPAHFGAMAVMNIAIGLVTPPQAWNTAAAVRAAEADVRGAVLGALPLLLVMLAALALVALVPAVSLWFPRLFGWPA